MAVLMKMKCIFLALAVGMTSALAVADDDDDDDFSNIRELVRQGKIYPLEQILDKYLPQYPGRLLDLEVEDEHGRIIYELEILQSDRRVVELKIDAATGRLLEKEIDD